MSDRMNFLTGIFLWISFILELYKKYETNQFLYRSHLT